MQMKIHPPLSRSRWMTACSPSQLSSSSSNVGIWSDSITREQVYDGGATKRAARDGRPFRDSSSSVDAERVAEPIEVPGAVEPIDPARPCAVAVEPVRGHARDDVRVADEV